MNYSNFVNKFFGPLPKDYCNYFFYMSVFFFIVLTSSLASMGVMFITNYKSINLRVLMQWMYLLVNALLAYYVNRMLYSICINSYN